MKPKVLILRKYPKVSFKWLIIAWALIFFINNEKAYSQNFYIPNGGWYGYYTIEDNYCSECDLVEVNSTAPQDFWGGASFGPDGYIYSLSQFPDQSIYQVDVATGIGTLLYTAPAGTVRMQGLAAVGGGIFYTMPEISPGYIPKDTLYRWDINAGTITNLGNTGYNNWGELWIANGDIYYISHDPGDTLRHIIRIDPINPANSQLVCSFPSPYGIFGMTATQNASVFIGTEIYLGVVDVYTINITDCSLTFICSVDEGAIGGAFITNTSPYEHDLDPQNEIYVDLDCDDSSGATEADYNGEPFDCLKVNGVAISDFDNKILTNASIAQLTVEVSNPINFPEEVLDMAGSISAINVTGLGTSMLTMNNTGTAKINDFKNALKLVRYINAALNPSAGQRIIEVRFTTSLGTMSNIASAFIEVNELPQLVVDLGPDIEFCDGGSITLDAGHAGAIYEWSNGEISQTITVNTSGSYSVTVFDGVYCPNEDDINVTELPVINIWLTGDTLVCQNDAASLTITTDSSIPIDVEITPSPGFPIILGNVTGSQSFTEYPFSLTEYVISEVISSQPACINIIDDFQIIEVYPQFQSNDSMMLCAGDSLLLGNEWVDQPGIYPVHLSSVHGCDSLVSYNISLLPSHQIDYFLTTCDPAQAGTFISYLENPLGCDTVVYSTYQLLTSDTLNLFSTHCSSDSTGIFEEIFTNIFGCDSLVVHNVSLTPPMDTTFLNSISCDSSAQGIFLQLLNNMEGCDSIVVLTVNPGSADTTHVSSTSCDSSSLGIFEDHFISLSGCDSTVLNTVTYSLSDSTFVQAFSCDSSEAGNFMEVFVSQDGCDSIVFTTVSLWPDHQVFLSSTTCDSSQTGTFEYVFINQYGCDSIVTETVTILPSDHTFVAYTTCEAGEAGVFTESLVNQFGCDSLVTTTVTHIPSDTTIFYFKTCDPAQTGVNAISLTNQFGCDSIILEVTELYLLPQVDVQSAADYNGFDVSCPGASDGSINALAQGSGPFSFAWSNNETGQILHMAGAGLYQVTVTDGNGCQATGEIQLIAPEELSMLITINEPECYDDEQGSITIEAVGGAGDYQYSIDGVNYQTFPVFEGLPEGAYHTSVLDANDCEIKDILWINVPLNVHVDLGKDTVLALGDTAFLHAIVDIPYDSISSVIWFGNLDGNCPECLDQAVAPVITTGYSITVTSIDGCIGEDAINISVEVNEDIYVPNIFSPNGDSRNDKLIIGAGSSIREIISFTIFDRWGNAVFAARNFQAGDENYAWDGKKNGRVLNPGAFAYHLIAEAKDGKQIILHGDITLAR